MIRCVGPSDFRKQPYATTCTFCVYIGTKYLHKVICSVFHQSNRWSLTFTPYVLSPEFLILSLPYNMVWLNKGQYCTNFKIMFPSSFLSSYLLQYKIHRFSFLKDFFAFLVSFSVIVHLRSLPHLVITVSIPRTSLLVVLPNLLMWNISLSQLINF